MKQEPIRTGWLSLIVLVVVVCLAVLGVLSLVTGRTMLATAQKQADYVQQTYALETLGQQWLAQVQTGWEQSATPEQLLETLPEGTELDGDLLRYVAQTDEDRQLSIAVQLEEGQVRVVEWQQLRQWKETENVGQLWEG